MNSVGEFESRCLELARRMVENGTCSTDTALAFLECAESGLLSEAELSRLESEN